MDQDTPSPIHQDSRIIIKYASNHIYNVNTRSQCIIFNLVIIIDEQ